MGLVASTACGTGPGMELVAPALAGSFFTTVRVKVKVLVIKSCLTLCDPVDCSLPGFCVHWILLERILEWIAIPFSRVLPDLGLEPGSPALQVGSLMSEPLRKPPLPQHHQGSPRPHFWLLFNFFVASLIWWWKEIEKLESLLLFTNLMTLLDKLLNLSEP